MKDKLLVILIMMISVPLAGELKFFPFEGNFRVSFGTPVFFFFLLWLRNVNAFYSGLLVGTTVVAFRMLLHSFNIGELNWEDSFPLHFPAFIYYSSYGSMFYLLKMHRAYDKPFIIGLGGVILEIAASLAEMAGRYPLSGSTFTTSSVLLIITIAFIRSFFVLGFYNILIYRQARFAEEQQRKKNEKMLMLISNLYIENVQLNKTMQQAEDVTRDCYELYRDLKEDSNEAFAKAALKIAGRVHEIKKDNQRIYAGLSKLIGNQKTIDYLPIEEIINIIIESNQQYSQLLKKSISFEKSIEGKHPPYQTYLLLSILNNLVTNAVEAIENKGIISIFVTRIDEVVSFHIMDNGPGIPEKKNPFIFQPGYTTKYDISGKPSTGIGLSYVKEVLEHIGGEITLLNQNEKSKTTFIVKIPSHSLIRKG